MRLRRFLILAASLAIVSLVAGGLYLFQALPSSPEEALKRFHTETVAEDQLMDPLILGGEKVVPLLLKEIQDKNMQRRRYGIAALGHLGDPSAIPMLDHIFKDPSEIDYFRCDALEAIALLDFNAARVLAKEQLTSTIGCISQLSGSLDEGKLPSRRTYLQALVGWHQ